MKLTAVISGNITGDPEQFTPNNGDSVLLSFSVANNDRQKKGEDGVYKDEPSFVNLQYWTKNPAYWLQRIQRGCKFFSNCEIIQERWEKEGQKHSKIVFRVSDKFPEIIHKADIASQPQAAKPNQPQGPGNAGGGSFEDDIPF